MKKINIYTDLALEERERFKRNIEISGVKIDKNYNKELFMTTTDVEIFNENGAKSMGKPIGSYVTMETRLFKEDDLERQNIFAKEIANHMEEMTKNQNIKKILIVGLGNSKATPDSLGPKVVQTVDITRHLINFAKDLVEPDTRSVSALSPGVLGTTGIETSEIITSVCNEVKPDIVIAIDSLASSSINRLGTTIQLSNTGITPGAGVRNKREGINQNTLNVPVIAIGVPTVVDMATITSEAIDKMVEVTKQKIENGDNSVNKEQIEKVINIFNDDNKYNMIANVLDTDNFIVTPKEIDDVIQIVSDLISGGINMSIN